jgi:hypothetical protein
MGFYENRILPHLINLAMSKRELLPYRQRVISAAEGRVLRSGYTSILRPVPSSLNRAWSSDTLSRSSQ